MFLSIQMIAFALIEANERDFLIIIVVAVYIAIFPFSTGFDQIQTWYYIDMTIWRSDVVLIALYGWLALSFR